MGSSVPNVVIRAIVTQKMVSIENAIDASILLLLLQEHSFINVKYLYRKPL